jgi:hypothetical protein
MNNWDIKSNALALWAIAWLAAAAVAVSTTIGAADEPPLVSLHESGDRVATLNSVTAELSAIEASEGETVVRVGTVGREADGNSVELSGPAELRLNDGSVLLERRGQSNGRSLVMYFDALPAGRTVQSLVLPGLALVRSDLPLEDESRFQPVGSFTLGSAGLDLTIRPSRSAVESAESPFGRGTLEVTKLVISGDEILVVGRIAGYTREEIHGALVLEPPSLKLADGMNATYESTRVGFSEDPGVFEMRFVLANAVAGKAELRLQALWLPDGNTASVIVSIQVP